MREEISQFRSGVYRCNPPLIDPVNIDSHLANDVVKEPQAVDESVPLFGHVSIDSHLANEVVEQTQTVDESFASVSPDCLKWGREWSGTLRRCAFTDAYYDPISGFCLLPGLQVGILA